ncbi:hypothetical protein GSI_02757 [Ganoderma sinense ZZ0214-1]|uniref:Uncharacterized protein n=1 Tax=Ganoderma sinense ZZ0214-1 TaxID=1077348 RepID=A0A2G8SMI8_9APHY|nr:hypothetical protein GSI_02757 [Ganoderma sinense ZZ0214-1]
MRKLRRNAVIPGERPSSAVYGRYEGGGSEPLKFLSIFTPGSPQAEIPSTACLLPVTGRVVKKWAIDDAQDLLVTVEWSNVPNSDPTLPKREEVFFYSLSGSKTARTPHPAATVPSLVVFPPDGVAPTESIHIFKLCIAREYVVIEPYVSAVNYHSLDVWNWMTGQFIKRIEVPGRSLVNFVPLDGIYVLVIMRYSALCVDIYALAQSAPNHPICALEFPQDVTSKFPFSCQIATGDRPVSSPGHFRADPSLSIVSVALYTEDIQYEYASIFLIPHATLLAHIRKAESRQLQEDHTTEPGGAVVRVPWADWGPCGCLRLRLQQCPHHSSHMSLFPSGSRAPVVPFQVSKIWERIDSFFVFELNPLAARLAKQRLRARGRDQPPSELEDTAMVEDVEAALPGVVDPECSAIPYVVYRFKIPGSSTNWHSTGQTIRAVEMSMTGFTVQFDGVDFEESLQTWTV